MFSHYFNLPKKKEKKIASEIYFKIINKSKQFIEKNNKYFDEVNFKLSFEIFTLFAILFIKNIKDLKPNNYKFINDEIINLYVKDLDIIMREHGISDMKVGKYVKFYVKKFYYRLKLLDKIYEFENLDNLSNYINKLKISNLSNTLDLSREILDYLQKNRKEIKLFFK